MRAQRCQHIRERFARRELEQVDIVGLRACVHHRKGMHATGVDGGWQADVEIAQGDGPVRYWRAVGKAIIAVHAG